MAETVQLIEFKCGKCGRGFSVPASFVGRRAKCKTCGAELTVPSLATAAAQSSAALFAHPSNSAAESAELSQTAPSQTAPSPPAQAPRRISPRDRRLMSDHDALKKSLASCDWIQLESIEGLPPDRYEVAFRVAGLRHGASAEKPDPQPEHRVEIKLTGEYPRTKPLCRMLTPVFHPNIDTATICVGDYWTAGERLVDLVVRIAEMLCYQDYNIKSPLDAEAAMWADLNAEKLPLDHRNLHPPEME